MGRLLPGLGRVHGPSLRTPTALRSLALRADAVASHLIRPQALHDLRGHQLSHDIELAALELVVGYEADEGMTIHRQAAFAKRKVSVSPAMVG